MKASWRGVLASLGTVFLVASAGVLGCAPTDSVIFGRVTIDGQGTPATVTLSFADESTPTTGTTIRTEVTTTGDYTFVALQPGNYQVSATVPGHQCESKVLSLPRGVESNVNLACTPPPATIVVMVTNQGAPVSGATVTVTGPSPGSEVTGPNGVATFTNRAPGSYAITAIRDIGLSCPPTTANLAAGETANVTIACTPVPATINVTVTNQGEPVQGASVSLTGPEDAIAVTGPDGRVSFPGRAAGSYTVVTSRDGLDCPTQTAIAAAGQATNVAVACSPLGLAVATPGGGDDQEGEILVPLAAPFVVQLVANNQPVMQAGRMVSFVFETGTGQLSVQTGTTDLSGKVQTLLTPSSTPGPVVVRAELGGGIAQPGSPVARFDALINRGPPPAEIAGQFIGTGTASVNQCGMPNFNTFNPIIVNGPGQGQLTWQSIQNLIALYERIQGTFTAEASTTSGNTVSTEAVTGTFSRLTPPTNLRVRFVGRLSFGQHDLETSTECITSYNIVLLHQP